MLSAREDIAYYRDIAGNLVSVGDGVAAATRNASGLRVGEVLKITGRYASGIGYRQVRVQVRVEITGNSMAGQKYNKETHSWEAKPFTMTYDGESVVKLGG